MKKEKNCIGQINLEEMEKLAHAKTTRKVFEILGECIDRQEGKGDYNEN